jgi:NTP pyrophosphatase (non-canonical NTP hydrolase)
MTMSNSQDRTAPATKSSQDPSTLTLPEMQRLIAQMYGQKDAARGISGTFMWLMEEVGELATALREEPAGQAQPSEALASEFADVLAWLVTIANVANVNLAEAFCNKYAKGCPGCDQRICQCALSEKP